MIIIYKICKIFIFHLSGKPGKGKKKRNYNRDSRGLYDTPTHPASQ
jgi:hypothetical protein